MIISSWRFTATETLARSTAWRDVDHCYVSAVNIKPRMHGIAARVVKSAWLRLFLRPAVLGLAASTLVCCAEQQPPLPPATAAVQPPQQAAPKVPPPAV